MQAEDESSSRTNEKRLPSSYAVRVEASNGHFLRSLPWTGLNTAGDVLLSRPYRENGVGDHIQQPKDNVDGVASERTQNAAARISYA